MKTTHNTELVRAAGLGYLIALRDSHEDPSGVDTWFECGPYDLNICGDYYVEQAPKNGLFITVYPAGWMEQLPEALFTVTINPTK